jgi:hypothetical protein
VAASHLPHAPALHASCVRATSQCPCHERFKLDSITTWQSDQTEAPTIYARLPVLCHGLGKLARVGGS